MCSVAKDRKHIKLTLPYPPSINHYYGRGRNGRLFIKKPGLQFRNDVLACFLEHPLYYPSDEAFLGGTLAMSVIAYPPDYRKRDLGNVIKALEDALEKARILDDDEQIWKFDYTWAYNDEGEKIIVKGGKVEVKLEEI